MDHYKSLMPGSGHDMVDEQRVVPGLEGFVPRNNLPTAWNLVQFYASNTDPWVPRHTIPQDSPQFPAKPNSFSPTSAVPHGHYAPSRSNAPYDYTVSDSGYESRTKKSAENTSVFEGMDRSQDARSVTGRLADFHPFGAATEQFAHASASQRDYRPQHWLPQTAPQESRPSVPTSGLFCRTCSRNVKNKSELKKHDQRHNKPHKCDVQGCNRKEGFSTTNDLDRHKRSVHSADGVKFRCRLGQCIGKDKTWPRADNFRSHLKRVHNHVVEADGDLTEFTIGASQPAGPEPPAYLEGVGSGVGSSLMDYPGYPSVTGQSIWYADQRPSTDLDMSEASPVSLSVPFPSQQRTEDVNGTDISLTQSRPCISPSINQTRPSVVTSNSQTSAGSSINLYENVLPDPRKAEGLSTSASTADVLTEKIQEPQRMVGSPKAASETLESVADEACSSSATTEKDEPVSISTEEVDDEGTSQDDGENVSLEHEEEDDGDEEDDEEEKRVETPSEAQPEKPDEAAFLQLLQGVPSEILEKFMKDRKLQMSKNAKSSGANSAETQTHPCKKCEKVFARPCELKKHMKRHSKPYGCTFAKCNRKFGSKNDWKRHENSQHMQLETWKCHQPNNEGTGAGCGKVFSRREQFKNHLSSHHDISDAATLEKELLERRIGRNGDSTFWCGFCVKIISLPKDPNSWTERFNHIDDHFSGKNGLPQQDIADWQYLEAVDGSSGPSSDDTSLEEDQLPKTEPVLPEPAPAPMIKKKRSAEDGLLPAAKRNRG